MSDVSTQWLPAHTIGGGGGVFGGGGGGDCGGILAKERRPRRDEATAPTIVFWGWASSEPMLSVSAEPVLWLRTTASTQHQLIEHLENGVINSGCRGSTLAHRALQKSFKLAMEAVKW
tara:strand:- start:17 stop:370 length:354 start_codon:yes stop_codon:yes gene_type:complete